MESSKWKMYIRINVVLLLLNNNLLEKRFEEKERGVSMINQLRKIYPSLIVY